ELHFLIVAACFGRGRPQFPPSSSIGKSRLADQDTGVRFEKSRKKSAAPRRRLPSARALVFEHETFCDVRAGFLILRVHGELLWREASQFAQHSGSATPEAKASAPLAKRAEPRREMSCTVKHFARSAAESRFCTNP